MQKLHFNFGMGMFFLLWVVVAQAQAILAPGFGSELQRITPLTWACVCVFGALGTMARVQAAIKSKEMQFTLVDVTAWMLIGLFATMLAFAACEGTKELTGRRIPDLFEGAIISAAAYDPRAAIAWFLVRLRRFLRADDTPGTPPGATP